MRIAVIGADGQLGCELSKLIYPEDLVSLTIKDIDITNEKSVNYALLTHSPKFVINTAAYHKVDDCEDNKAAAFATNSIGAKTLALCCRNMGIGMAQISTDYVFDGEKSSPYVEDDRPNPKTVYGESKLIGELYIRYILPEHYIIRTCGLYGAAGCMGKGGGNFVENVITKAKEGKKIQIVSDEFVSPTYARDLAKKILEILRTRHYGLYHVTNSGSCSWWAFASKIFELLGYHTPIEKIKRSDYKTRAPRPQYSVLESSRLKQIGIKPLRKWDEALKDYLAEKGHLKS